MQNLKFMTFSIFIVYCSIYSYGQSSDQTKKGGMLFYEPGTDNPAADVWCIKNDSLWYVYTLNGYSQSSIGVAVSPDLLQYEYRGIAITNEYPWENGLFGGDVFNWKGKNYMLYSAPGTGYDNAIGLAESEDMVTWKKYSGNPVMHHPDNRWYEGESNDGMRGGISCRDVSVIEDAFTEEWVYCCFTASTGRGDFYRRGCIGLARSKNLIDWEYLPPLFYPAIYTAMEVPRVCKIGNKWFLTWLTAPWYGIRTDEDYGQRAYTTGETMIHYAVSDKPLGPYHLGKDPTLFRGNASPYVIDLVHDGEQVKVATTMFRQKGPGFYDRERCGLMPAMPIRQAANDPEKLQICFPEELRKYFNKNLPLVNQLIVNNPLPGFQDVVKEGSGITFTKTSNRVVELTDSTKYDLIIDVRFEVESGRVGLVTRYDRDARKGCVVLVDPKRKELQFTTLGPLYERGIGLGLLERFNITSSVKSSFLLSVIQSENYQQVFVDGILAATFSFARRDAGTVGLFLENATGKAKVEGIHAFQP